jgi:hypothetical protein
MPVTACDHVEERALIAAGGVELAATAAVSIPAVARTNLEEVSTT